MTVLSAITDKLRSINPDKVVANAVKRNSKKIEDLNRNQLRRSMLSDNERIKNILTGRETYTNNPLNKKLGRVNQRYKLRLTGKYYASIKADVKADRFFMKSTDIKRAKIRRQYTKKTLGLTPNSTTATQRLIKKDLTRQINSILVA